MRTHRCLLFTAVLAIGLVACDDTADLPVAAGTGPNPALPPPVHNIIPTVNIAPARGWKEGERPAPASGLKVSLFARQLDHPRWIYVLPNGDVLVAETNAQAQEPDGLTEWIKKRVKDIAGAGAPSADRITLLRDENGDGNADYRSIFLQGLHSPFGMALIGENFYVANTNALLRFPYRKGATHIIDRGEKILDLPAGPPNRHWTKSLVASPDGQKLYIGIGSNSDHGENGLEKENGRAAIWEVDVRTRKYRVYASGLRNPVGMDWEPHTGELWVAVNERDRLGGDLVPDYMTPVQDGAFYGWPFSYFGQHADTRVEPQRPDLIEKAIVPDYALGAHTASLGLSFATADSLTPEFRPGVFIGQHGSWNRDPPSGYRVVFVPFEDGKPAGQPIDVLTGFLDIDGNARGRPVGVVVGPEGGLLVADDVGNVIWRVTPKPVNRASSPM